MAAVAVTVASAPLAAQSSAPERAVPRTADGKPDLSGIWVATGAIMLFEGQEAFAAARAADEAAGRPPGNTGEAPPYNAEAEAQLVARCLGHGDRLAADLADLQPRWNGFGGKHAEAVDRAAAHRHRELLVAGVAGEGGHAVSPGARFRRRAPAA